MGYALLTQLSTQTSSEERREFLRRVTGDLGHSEHSESEFAELDGVLSVAPEVIGLDTSHKGRGYDVYSNKPQPPQGERTISSVRRQHL
jgi:hypothetical protein